MTVVEWYTKQILEYKSPTNINGTDYILIPVDKIDFLKEQAKEMEEEQTINAVLYGFREDSDGDDWEGDNYNAEKYMKENFKSE